MPLLSIIIAIAILWYLHIGRPWYHYWNRARQLDLPIIVSPTSSGSFLWRCLQFASGHGLLPDLLAKLAFIRLSQPNWAFREKFSIYQDYGRYFVLVTPNGCELLLADRIAAKDILSRRNDFPKPIKMLGRLDVFGKNVASAEGPDWKYHRRLVTKAFHEKVNNAVWAVSAKQAMAVLDNWVNNHTVQTTQTDMTTLSLNVLFKACIDVNGETGDNADTIESCQHYLTNFLKDIPRPKPLEYWEYQRMKANVKALAGCLNEIVNNRLSCSTPNLQADLLSFLLNSANEIGLAN